MIHDDIEPNSCFIIFFQILLNFYGDESPHLQTHIFWPSPRSSHFWNKAWTKMKNITYLHFQQTQEHNATETNE